MLSRVFTWRTTGCAVWLLVIGTGFGWILNYQNASGHIGTAPQSWPSGAQLALDARHDTLLMFAHPQCPCTRASLEELNRVLAQSHGQAAVRVFFFKPAESADDWTKTDLWRSAAAIPGVTVHEDIDGAQANLFGAETSGDVLVYDPHGRLLFQGGITGGRGHAGDNTGQNIVAALLSGHETVAMKTPVYGCSLLNEAGVPGGIAK
jgi:hypothetical protein